MAGGRMARRVAAMVLAGLAWGIVLASDADAQRSDDPAALNAEVVRLYQAGKYAEATEIAKRLLAIDEKMLGPDHPHVATALNNLASLYGAQGRHAEAEQLHKRSLAIRERALGPEHPDVGTALNNLAGLYQDQGRYAEAEPLLQRSLAIHERGLGPEHPDVGVSLNNLAELYRAQGRYAEAEPLYKRSLAIREKALGPEHPDVGQSLNNLALLYEAQGHYGEAEHLYERSLAIWEKVLEPEHHTIGISLNNLALLYVQQGRYAEAEPLFSRSLAIREKVLGREHPEVGDLLNNLAWLYGAQRRYADAERLYRRGFAIREKALGPDHSLVGQSLNNLAELYRDQGRYAEAEPLHRRSLAINLKALGSEHPAVGTSLNNLAELYRAQGRYAEAEPLYERSLSIREKALGPNHSLVGQSLNNLAELYRNQGRDADAERLYRRSLAINLKALGSEHPEVGTSLSNLAVLAYIQSNWAGAADYWRRSTGIIKRRAERGLPGGRGEVSRGEARRLAWQFWGLVSATHRMAAQGGKPTGTLAAEMFETAQWGLSSEAAASLAHMAARSAKGSPQLAGIVRERQDLVGEWQVKDKLLIAARSEPPARRKAEAEKALADRLAAIDSRLAEIDRRFVQEFPDYAALASPAPVPIAEVQAQLGADEALVLFLDTPEPGPLPEETFIWIVTKSDMRWVRSGLGTAALRREVAALRCGLDAAAWDGTGAERCTKALGMAPVKEAPDPLPFGHARAHKLYMGLFGAVRDLIGGKHLLIVPSGALTQLPFQVLVTAEGVRPCGSDPGAQPCEGGGDEQKRKGSGMGSDPQGLTPSAMGSDPQGLTPIAWLARSHAVTVLPAVSSLKALRRVGRPSAAPRPMIGFGNPLLDGPDGRYADHARLARTKQHCPEAQPQRVAARADVIRGVAGVETRGGLANLAHIKMQAPLPETADELCAVARSVKAEARDIRLGAQATEREVKRLSAGGELAQFRMVHFATHGALAGELDGTREPGLILTPPETASEEDDGYLSASEIAGLRLDADWVVLSACNTAAGAAASAEALSGLARAFIYAGARALLVSHWAVNSEAAVKLITGAAGAMARDPKVGRAEALRHAMLALIDKGTRRETHPAYWAPFIVVGEGAAGR